MVLCRGAWERLGLEQIPKTRGTISLSPQTNRWNSREAEKAETSEEAVSGPLKQGQYLAKVPSTATECTLLHSGAGWGI